MYGYSEKELMFLQSGLTEDNPFISTAEVQKWILERNRAVQVKIDRVEFRDLDKWRFLDNKGLVHDSGGFFSIEGIRVKTNYGMIDSWDQPIINQPEIGYLGLLTKTFGGILYFLVQAKIEPGNKNNVQLSPTLQATKSNYTRLHEGKSPRYLEYFTDKERGTVLLDQLQSEQGARFLQKRNRNIIIQVEEDIHVHEDFVWMTLAQIKKLIQLDNIVNMDTRTVISGIPFGNFDTGLMEYFSSFNLSSTKLNFKMLNSALKSDSGLHSLDEIIAWFTELKCKFELNISNIPLSEIRNWSVKKDEIVHDSGKYFKIIGANVEISNREVSKWMQPLVEPAQEGLLAFLIKEFNGVYHFLVQAKLECGNFDILELAPTVQCLTGNYRHSKEGSLPFLDLVLNADLTSIKYDSMQSEEGGRFYKEQNRNVIIELSEDLEDPLPENFCWMTLNQLISFVRFNNYLNIQARSLISAIQFI